jgi:hypothetical protein
LFTVHSCSVHRDVSPARYWSDLTENSSYDLRVQSVEQRLHEDLVDETGCPADPNDVDRAADDSAEILADAPVQEFVPLLIEHQARDELRKHGLRRDLGDDEEEPATPRAGTI